jgi:hypothetical protein
MRMMEVQVQERRGGQGEASVRQSTPHVVVAVQDPVAQVKLERPLFGGLTACAFSAPFLTLSEAPIVRCK